MAPTNLSDYLLWGAPIAAALYLTWSRNASRSKLPLPPGPRKLPILGNLLDVGGRPMSEACRDWSREYNSDIIHLNLAGTSIIVLSSLEATDNLMEKRSAIYSDRPPMPMLYMMGFEYLLIFMKYGEMWKTQRRLLNHHLSVSATQNVHPLERKAAHALIRRLLHNPEAFLDHLRVMIGDVIVPFAYGIDVQPTDDPYVTLIEKAVRCGSQVVPGRFLVDNFPLLKYVPEWMPGAGFKKIAREGRVLTQALRNVPFAEAKRQMMSGEVKPSFTASALRDLEAEDNYYDENIVKDVAATMYTAGGDTTVLGLSTFFLAMLANPEAQRKAQQEIDAVVGVGNLPDFRDQDHMPYVAALVKEILRWKPITPLGVPHYLTADDEYHGYRLPANSIVFGNVVAILGDENIYPNPEKFDPERFLLDGKLNPLVPDPVAAFGFGRRLCPGRHIAESSIWIAVVSVLAVFNIKKEVDKDGNVVEPSYEYGDGILSAPHPFKCTLEVRSEMAARLVIESANDV
ncbi:cytochrome P450 [Roridomyces roridus]|uniref:Cytochrome P450 n=1 Tax=Roridomyces roridus TaxID=1738132 RepID=A0AAD7BET0_9AGAR|nr:cytochrome P450 [Roridomyces roridus]